MLQNGHAQCAIVCLKLLLKMHRGLSFLSIPPPIPPQMRNARFQLISTYFFYTHPSPLVVAFSGALQCRRSHLGLKC